MISIFLLHSLLIRIPFNVVFSKTSSIFMFCNVLLLWFNFIKWYIWVINPLRYNIYSCCSLIIILGNKLLVLKYVKIVNICRWTTIYLIYFLNESDIAFILSYYVILCWKPLFSICYIMITSYFYALLLVWHSVHK